MARVLWLGEDGEGVAGPSFTTCFGKKFPKGEPVELTDADMIRRAAGNPFFRVESESPPALPAPEPPAHDEPQDDLKGLSIAELRNMADASGIDYAGLSKAELREAILAHDGQANEQDPS